VTRRDCAAPLAFATLAEYWLGELDAVREAALEEHLLGCGQCSAALRELAELGGGIRALVRSGALRMVLPGAFVGRLAATGLRLREYRVPMNGGVNCTVAPEDDLVVAHLEAPLAGVERLDLELLDYGSGVPERVRDVPFDAAAGEVAFASRTGALRAAPAHRARVRLLAVDRGGERLIGEYAFHHRPWNEFSGRRDG
jgi:hypothetical protein